MHRLVVFTPLLWAACVPTSSSSDPVEEEGGGPKLPAHCGLDGDGSECAANAYSSPKSIDPQDEIAGAKDSDVADGSGDSFDDEDLDGKGSHPLGDEVHVEARSLGDIAGTKDSDVADGSGASFADEDLDGEGSLLGDEYLEAALPPVLIGSYQVTSPKELKAEIIAAERALEMRAVVDGAPQVYDSPSVSISVRKVSQEAMLRNATTVAAPDGAGIEIPRGIKSPSGGPVTVTITSYHASEKIMKNMPKDLRMRFEKEPSPSDEAAKQLDEENLAETGENGTTALQNASDGQVGPDNASDTEGDTLPKKPEAEPEPAEPKLAGDRVDFFTTKTSVSWRGNVNVKYAGLGATVPAHDRTPGQKPGGSTYGTEDEVRFPDEKKEVYAEVERIADLPRIERARALRQLARRWHPDKNPEDMDRATDVFNYLQELKEEFLGEGGGGLRALREET